MSASVSPPTDLQAPFLRLQQLRRMTADHAPGMVRHHSSPILRHRFSIDVSILCAYFMSMRSAFNSNRRVRGTATRATNVSLDAALVAEAKSLGVNISLASAWGLEQAVAKARAERWIEENRAALDSYNAYVEANGLPLDDLRLF